MIIFWFLMGACLGSFGYATYLRKKEAPGHESVESLLAPSECPVCHAKIHWSDNLPLISFLILRGHCRACKAEIPVDYFLWELAGGAVGVLLYAVAY